MYLQEGTFLQGGKYKIIRMLGQGGFGITYLGIQMGLNRMVAIKEFFMTEHCNRDENTSYVGLGSSTNHRMLECFRHKFVKEAQIIATLDHPHIIRIYDIFEENGTAYYVMEYLSGGDLYGRIPKDGMIESEALSYIRQIGDALMYIHNKNILHLDIKPSNILFRSNGDSVLVDFGISKHYDEASGDQTTSTPLGVSEGYAPTEQYECGGLSSFSVTTDVYSLGATFYCLLQGSHPPRASIVLNDGLPSLPSSVSLSTRKAIEAAMQPRRKDRPQSVKSFLSLLNGSVGNEKTVIDYIPTKVHIPNPSPTRNKWLISLVVCFIVALCIYILYSIFHKDRVVDPINDILYMDTLDYNDSASMFSPSVNAPNSAVRENIDISSTCLFYVSTFPNGALIYVDGQCIGKSPIEGKEISCGNHTIKIELDGYREITKKYNFSEKPIVINETLVANALDQISIPSLKKEEFSEPEIPEKMRTKGIINGHEYIDLGLSVKWADRNLGSFVPEEDGYYITWKGITANELYEWGATWRLPTKAEFAELLNKCKWIWHSQGYYKVIGPNGNSIFFPASGFRIGKTLTDNNEGGYYWCSSPYENGSQDAYFLYFYSGDQTVTWGNIDVERSVRYVSK